MSLCRLNVEFENRKEKKKEKKKDDKYQAAGT
jgi:hypothetical protein